MSGKIALILAAAVLILSAASSAPEDSASWSGYRLGTPVAPTSDGNEMVAAVAPWDETYAHATNGVLTELRFVSTARSDYAAASFAKKRIAEVTARFGPPVALDDLATWQFADPAHPERGLDSISFLGIVTRSPGSAVPAGTPADPVLAGITIWHDGLRTRMVVASHDAYAPPAPPPPPPTPEHPYVVDLDRFPACPVSYPSAALRANAQGRATAKFVIDDTHHMTSCAITAGSGSVYLDSATCRYMRCAAEGDNAAGHPWAPGEDSKSMVWRIPS